MSQNPPSTGWNFLVYSGDMDDRELWNLIREVLTRLNESIDRAVEPILAETGLNGRNLGLLLAALTFEPENTTAAHLMVRRPYIAAEEYRFRLMKAAGLCFLEEVSPGSFRLTPAGRTAVRYFIEKARSAIAAADPLPREDSSRIGAILARLVKLCLDTEPPPGTWSIQLSYKLMPEAEPSLPYIEQAISCLSAYRDDAHLAAWQGSDLTATALEVLTLLWRKEAKSLAELTERLVDRGHPMQVYADAVEELRYRGFVEGTEHTLRLTEEGQRFRDQVEADTDRYFFTPWAQLTDPERDNLAHLLAGLRDGL
jgi:hypothetical protein